MIELITYDNQTIVVDKSRIEFVRVDKGMNVWVNLIGGSSFCLAGTKEELLAKLNKQ